MSFITHVSHIYIYEMHELIVPVAGLGEDINVNLVVSLLVSCCCGLSVISSRRLVIVPIIQTQLNRFRVVPDTDFI